MSNGISAAKAYRNDEGVWIAWATDPPGIPGCLGFAVVRECLDGTGAVTGEYPLATYVVFQGQSNPHWHAQNTTFWPSQRSGWRNPTLRRRRDRPVYDGKRKLHITYALTLALVAVAASGWHGALAANGLERALGRLQPCQGLKVNIRLATVGVDNLEKLSVEEVTITVKGDAADAAVTGTLACRTSDAALVRGDASARFSATVHMDLATCAVSGQKVEVLSTGGTFGSLVDRFRHVIGRTLETGLADQLRKLCQ